jgi:cell wall-associated NlpC family hydrolase
MTTGADVVAAARRYIGTRWMHQGRTANGLDCIGLLVVALHDLGLSRADYREYGRMPEGPQMIALLRQHLCQLKGGGNRPGLVAAFALQGNPIHVGILSDVGIIHVNASLRRVVEHRLAEDWVRRLTARYAIPGVEY